ncbi:MAG TPA: acyl-CoA thioesterase [Desulfuromonadaceae bacterium]|jgi:acyl-CoA thioester hydrolase
MSYHETIIRVRFNEIDSYRIAWHGHYVSWMEEGRNDLAGRFGLDAEQIAGAGYLAPVVALDLKFKRTIRFGEELRIRTALRPTKTATLDFTSSIIGGDGSLSASGRTLHVLTTLTGELVYQMPQLLVDRLRLLQTYLGAA